MGRPVVGSVRGEAADILRRSGGALLVEPEDSRAIAGAVLGLSRDAERAREMGRRGREFVVANYSRRSLAAAYLSVIEGAVEEHRDARR